MLMQHVGLRGVSNFALDAVRIRMKTPNVKGHRAAMDCGSGIVSSDLDSPDHFSGDLCRLLGGSVGGNCNSLRATWHASHRSLVRLRQPTGMADRKKVGEH